MVTKESVGEKNCKICSENLSVTYKPTLINMWGVCNECGCPYEISQSDNEGFVNIEGTVLGSSWDYHLISNYYDKKGRPACLYRFCEYTDKELEEFLSWCKENYPDVEWDETQLAHE